jgi:hypothetical protein
MAHPGKLRQEPQYADQIRQELERVLGSAQFANSPRMARFLRVIVQAAIDGETGAFKEYAIGCSVFDRQPSFDPRLDPVVRNEARRLRQKSQIRSGSRCQKAGMRRISIGSNKRNQR